MGDKTGISWTDHTFNAWWGCTHADADLVTPSTSPECDNCYAETLDHRFGGQHWGPHAPRRMMRDAYWRLPLKWNAAAEREQWRHRVFCSSMADVFETHPVPDVQVFLHAQRTRLWQLIRATPWLDWQLLTKRPQNFARYLPWMASREDWHSVGVDHGAAQIAEPWPNVWLGVSIGVRRSLWRARLLRDTPATVRFISGEPLLEHISEYHWDNVLGPHDLGIGDNRIDWLIIGDESGHGRRPCQPDWVRTAREAAQRNSVEFHFKQWNGPLRGGVLGESKGRDGKIHLPILDGKQHAAIPQGIPRGQRDPVDPEHYQ